MIRANNGVNFIMKHHNNYMHKFGCIVEAIHPADMLVPLEYTFRSNYSSNGNMYSSIIGIKYMREGR